MPTILAFVRLRQENHKFEASLDILLKRERDAERKTQKNPDKSAECHNSDEELLF